MTTQIIQIIKKLFLIIFATTFIYSNLFANTKNILVLNSYHQGLLWTDNIVKGIQGVFDSSDMKTNLYIEYMDTKRNPPGESFSYLQKHYQQKYKDIKLDLIIVSDNNALSFVLLKENKLFHDKPIVFCGINSFKPALLNGRDNLTGIIENIDLKGTIALAKQTIPSLEKILFINDTTTSGEASKKALEEVLRDKEIQLLFKGFEYIDNIGSKELIDTISQLDKKTVIILFTFHRDKTGKWFSIEDYLSLITKNSSVPVFSMWDNYLEKGISGGVLLDGRMQGESSAKYALEILKGKPPSSIPIRMKSPNSSVIDIKQLEQYNLKLNLDNSKVLILNKEYSIFDQYKQEMIYITLLISILLLIIGILVIYSKRLSSYKNKEIKYENIIERLPGFAYHCKYNKKWTMKYVSTGFKKLTGYEATDVINNKLLSYSEIILPEDRELVWDNIEIQLTKFNQFELEYRIVTASNEVKWIWEQGVAIKDEKGDIKYLLGIILDINSKKLIEQKLVLSEYHYRNLFEEAEVSIWNEDFSKTFKKIQELKASGEIKDPKAYFYENKEFTLELLESIKVIDVNQATLNMFNAATKQELIENIDSTFSKGSFDVFIKELCAFWYNKDYFYEQAPFLTLDGKERHGIISFKIPKDTEHFNSVPVSIVDITETLNLETKYSQLFNTMREGYGAIDLENNIISVNKAFCEMLGYSENELLKMKLSDITPKNWLSFEVDFLEKSLQNSECTKLYEKEYICKNKTLLPVELSVCRSRNENGEHIGYWAIIRDIGDRKEVEKELKQKEEVMLLQSRHAAMGEMISMIAHQWRQPLTIIAMNANNILADIELDSIEIEVLRKNALNTISQTEELSNTIDDFKNFFKPVKSADEIYLKDLFDDVFNIIGKSLENNNISVNLDIESKGKIHTYSRELMQVLINILNNAKDVMSERDIAQEKRIINIEVRQEALEVLIKVSDCGGGIDENIIHKIFEPYFSTKSAKTGTGLGLYISKSIVEKHLNGTIEVYNTSDGACFEIRIESLKNS